jgi:hypothetical protein
MGEGPGDNPSSSQMEMGDTKLASSPTKPYQAELHHEEAELEGTNTL